MNVLHVISGIDPRDGGPSAALVGLVEAQAGCGLVTTVAATYRKGDDLLLAKRLESTVSHVRLIGPCRTPLRWNRGIKSAMRELVANADIVHIHGLWEEIQHQAARAAQRLGKPYLVRPCGMLDRWCLAQKWFKKWLYLLWRLRKDLNAARAIHYTTESEVTEAARLQLKAPAVIEPNGVQLAEFSDLPPRGTFRRRFPTLDERPMVLFLSRLHEKKGLDLLVPAFARAAAPETMLVIAGPDSGGYQAKVQALVDQQGLRDRVVFPGMLHGSERVAAFVDADLFVLSSYRENFGIAVVEALASGTPVIVSDQVAIHREITAAGAGAAVPLTVDALAVEMRRWLEDKDLREAAARRAQPFVREHYDWCKIAQRWVVRYQQLAT